MTNERNMVSEYFNANWEMYKEMVSKNSLYHNEMFSLLDHFLKEHFATRSFSLVDIGCGDSSVIAPSLVHTTIKKYIGIDSASDVLKLASTTLSHIKCEKEFICDDMTNAIARLNEPVDIFFSSYALHHLSFQEKVDFINTCKIKLATNGFFLMVDVVLEDKQSRDEWLLALEENCEKAHVDITPSELELRMDHPRKSDFPDSLATLRPLLKNNNGVNFVC